MRTELFRNVLIEATKRPENLRIWSRQLAVIGPAGDTELAILQRWWKENEAAFQARDYNKVKPGVLSIPGMQKSVMANPPDFDTTEPETSQSTPNATPAVKSAPETTAPAPIAAASDASTPSSAFLWTGAGVAIALLVGLVVFWKRRV